MERHKRYWEKKVKKAVKISKEFGFSEQNEEFWTRQPAGVISLLIQVHEEMTTHYNELYGENRE
jgi:hypothetical protein